MPRPNQDFPSYAAGVRKKFEALVKRGLKRKPRGIGGSAEESHGASEHMDGAAQRNATPNDNSVVGYDIKGFKGFGKGNLGIPLPMPDAGRPLPVPHARLPASSEVQSWIDEYFEELSCSAGSVPRKGDVVLWRGFKKGRRGFTSTTVEFFRGEVHEIIKDAHETFYSVS